MARDSLRLVDVADEADAGRFWRPRAARLDPKLNGVMPYPVPLVSAFHRYDADGNMIAAYDWLAAPDLEELAQRVIGEHQGHLAAADEYFDEIDFRWKREGGAKQGRSILGKTRKIGAAEKHYTDATFAIWLAADHLLYKGPADADGVKVGTPTRYIEMVLAHELSHIGETEAEDPKPALVGHDIEEFIWIAMAYGDVIEQPARDFAKQLQLRL